MYGNPSFWENYHFTAYENEQEVVTPFKNFDMYIFCCLMLLYDYIIIHCTYFWIMHHTKLVSSNIKRIYGITGSQKCMTECLISYFNRIKIVKQRKSKPKI